jgi:hypothetical protein
LLCLEARIRWNDDQVFHREELVSVPEGRLVGRAAVVGAAERCEADAARLARAPRAGKGIDEALDRRERQWLREEFRFPLAPALPQANLAVRLWLAQVVAVPQ